MKRILVVMMAALLLAGCAQQVDDKKDKGTKTGSESSVQVQEELRPYNGTHTGSAYISGYDSQPAAITIIDGSFSISLTSVYFYLEKKETAAAESLYDSQIKALSSQYQLGLITREEYENASAQYQKELDEKKVPIAAKYSNSLFSSYVQKDSTGYYAMVKGQKARMTFGSTGITYEDPVSGLTIRF